MAYCEIHLQSDISLRIFFSSRDGPGAQRQLPGTQTAGMSPTKDGAPLPGSLMGHFVQQRGVEQGKEAIRRHPKVKLESTNCDMKQIDVVSRYAYLSELKELPKSSGGIPL